MTTCAKCGRLYFPSTTDGVCGDCNTRTVYEQSWHMAVQPSPPDPITPRDLFAAAALAGMLAYRGHEYHEFVIDASARDAFEWADAMLAARKGQQ